MDKTWDHKKYEQKIYQIWEKHNAFTPKIIKGKIPFSIILPLPNASDPMHMGHALFTIQDILIRYHRMLGDPTLWLPGGDHAGIETQYIFEKELAKKGKSRFDYDRKTLYQKIMEFCDKNKDINKNQMKRLGFSMDWSRYHYSLEPEIVHKVFFTFEKLYNDNLVYRGERLVNYCTNCGTAFSELEIDYKEKEDFLYTLDYGPIKIATTRPETIFADVAVAVNPNDKRYKNLVGRKAVIPIIEVKIPIIVDSGIDIDFGTGALKVTPAHDETDFEIGKRNNLKTINIVDRNGLITSNDRVPHQLVGLSIKNAREKTVELLSQNEKLIKKERLIHNVGTCYRCANTIEPMIMPQWFVKTKPLALSAIKAVKTGRTTIFPKRFEKTYFNWMENIRDWNISRQIVWGPRIPAWYDIDKNPNLEVVFIDKKGIRRSGNIKTILNTNKGGKFIFEEVEKGLQQLIAPESSKFIISIKKPDGKFLQDTDTFDTWFLSGQWPLTTLGFNPENPKKSSSDFFYFYPTSVLDTLWDILFFWVGRMMIFGLYLTKEVPFKTIHLHSRVVDKLGKKMSKSKGNVVDPIEMVEKYGADALRMSLTVGIAPASDISVSEEKIIGMRNFANKIWNIARFVSIKAHDFGYENIGDIPQISKKTKFTKEDKKILRELNNLILSSARGIDGYRFGIVSEKLYHFIWHEFADRYIESTKDRLNKKDLDALCALSYSLLIIIKLLHPYMPFITEQIYQECYKKSPGDLLILQKWPLSFPEK